MNRSKWTWMIAVFIFIHLNLNAQEVTKMDRNIIYLEAIGIGGYGSINYERSVYGLRNQQIQFRIGFSTLNLRDFRNKLNPDLIIPIAISWLSGQQLNKHKIEIGAGQTLSNVAVNNTNSGEVDRNTAISATLNIGYRYQKPEGGIVFRIGYTPIFEAYENYRHWGGISFGYAF